MIIHTNCGRNEVENNFNPSLIKTRWKIDKKFQNDTIGYVFDVQFKLITLKKNKRLYLIGAFYLYTLAAYDII